MGRRAVVPRPVATPFGGALRILLQKILQEITILKNDSEGMKRLDPTGRGGQTERQRDRSTDDIETI